MDGTALRAAMEYRGYDAPMPLDRYEQMAPAVNKALRQAGCTTVERAAMFLAQIGAESGSLRWMEELADGTAYEGRNDLGNTHPGDGPRFKGRGPIQVTGRHNYRRLSVWAHDHGYVPTATYFVDHPAQLATDDYGFLGAVWYWTAARNMNGYADKRDIKGATYAVNGGYSNLEGRTKRWNKCLALGDAILPDHPKPLNLLERIVMMPGAPKGLTYKQFVADVADAVWAKKLTKKRTAGQMVRYTYNRLIRVEKKVR